MLYHIIATSLWPITIRLASADTIWVGRTTLRWSKNSPSPVKPQSRPLPNYQVPKEMLALYWIQFFWGHMGESRSLWQFKAGAFWSHGGSPSHHRFEYEVMVIHDLDDLAVPPHDFGNLHFSTCIWNSLQKCHMNQFSELLALPKSWAAYPYSNFQRCNFWFQPIFTDNIYVQTNSQKDFPGILAPTPSLPTPCSKSSRDCYGPAPVPRGCGWWCGGLSWRWNRRRSGHCGCWIHQKTHGKINENHGFLMVFDGFWWVFGSRWGVLKAFRPAASFEPFCWYWSIELKCHVSGGN